jgi:hypothetical protein
LVSEIFISKTRTSSITNAILLDYLDDYLKRLEAETQGDNSFQEYLDWVQSQDVEDAPYQLPEDWLKQSSTVQFSDMLAVTNLRSALSFKEVDYLVLAADDRGDSIYLVTSDPSALKLEEAEPPLYSSLTATNQLRIHPALISLSVSVIDDSTSHEIPKLVLPVGRLIHGKPNILLQNILDSILQGILLDGEVVGPDSLGRGTLRTPITYFETLLSDVPALIRYLEPPPDDKVALTEYFENLLLYKTQHRRSGWDVDFTGRAPPLKEAYTQRLFNILKGNIHDPQISRETLEKKRRELWHEVMQTSRNFRDTAYVVVIDAITPGHPVWIVESPQQKDDEGKYVVASGTAHAVQILSEVKQWLGSYDKLESRDIDYNLTESVMRYPLVVRTVEVIKSREIFSDAG